VTRRGGCVKRSGVAQGWTGWDLLAGDPASLGSSAGWDCCRRSTRRGSRIGGLRHHGGSIAPGDLLAIEVGYIEHLLHSQQQGSPGPHRDSLHQARSRSITPGGEGPGKGDVRGHPPRATFTNPGTSPSG
jgi:hypothetical protein